MKKQYMIIVAVSGNPNLEIFADHLSEKEAKKALEVANGLDFEFVRVCEHTDFTDAL